MSKPSKPTDAPTGSAFIGRTQVGATCCATVRDFIVVGGLSTDRFWIQWNAIGDGTDSAIPGTDDARPKQAGSQSFPTKFGWVTGISGNDFYMYIFQTHAISKGTYVGGDVVFSFDIFEEDRGCVRQGMMTTIDDMVVFESARGRHILQNDQITDIGYGLVDDTQ